MTINVRSSSITEIALFAMLLTAALFVAFESKIFGACMVYGAFIWSLRLANFQTLLPLSWQSKKVSYTIMALWPLALAVFLGVLAFYWLPFAVLPILYDKAEISRRRWAMVWTAYYIACAAVISLVIAAVVWQ